MADSPQDESRKLLAERELEAIHELAKAIAQEAGLVRDREREAAEKRHRQFIEDGREHWKAQIDFFKHMAVVSGASIVAVTALFGAIEPTLPDAYFYFVSALGFLVTAIITLVALFVASRRLVEFSLATAPPREEARKALTSNFNNWRLLTYASFSLGLTLLTLSVLFTSPPT